MILRYSSTEFVLVLQYYGFFKHVSSPKHALLLAAASTSQYIYLTSSNHRLGSAGLNALEELLFRCWRW